MTVPVTLPTTQTFSERADALGHFFQRAGEAPRLIAFDDEVGCPLHNALAALEWTSAVGILSDTDLLHAARLGETAAATVERRRNGQRVFVYLGPRMDAPPADPYEGALLFDEPGVRAFEFVQRAHALAHFLRATQGAGGVLSPSGEARSRAAPRQAGAFGGLSVSSAGRVKSDAGWVVRNDRWGHFVRSPACGRSLHLPRGIVRVLSRRQPVHHPTFATSRRPGCLNRGRAVARVD